MILRLRGTDRLMEQLDESGVGATIHPATEVVGETVRRAYDDAVTWAAGEPQNRSRPPGDLHWGDWPPDQMAR